MDDLLGIRKLWSMTKREWLDLVRTDKEGAIRVIEERTIDSVRLVYNYPDSATTGAKKKSKAGTAVVNALRYREIDSKELDTVLEEFLPVVFPEN